MIKGSDVLKKIANRNTVEIVIQKRKKLKKEDMYEKNEISSDWYGL